MQQKDSTPFFARYLEEQQAPAVKTSVKAGLGLSPIRPPGEVTMKWPSDDDEGEVM